MMKIIGFILFVSISITSYGQVDYSIFLKKKISKKDRKSFTDLSKFKKHVYSKCVEGNCKNGESILKVRFLKRKDYEYKYYHTILITGMFKNGKLNGKASIYYYIEDFYSTAKTGIFKQQKIPDMTKTIYSEYIEANFIDNIAYQGTYASKYGTNSVLTNVYKHKSLPIVKYFSKYKYNYNFDRKNRWPQKIYFQYDGKFNSLNFLDKKNILDNIEEVKINFYDGEWDFFNYTLTPTNEKDVLTMKSVTNIGLISKTYHGTELSRKIKIENNKCFGCDIRDISSDARKQDEKVKIDIQEQKNATINRAKSFVGHFIIGKYQSTVARVTEYNDKNGCIYAVVYPKKLKTDNNYIPFYDSCKHENYKIIPNAGVCPNCDGWGTEDAEVINVITHTTVNHLGDKTDQYKTYEKSGKYTKVSCSVCKGKGVITN